MALSTNDPRQERCFTTKDSGQRERSDERLLVRFVLVTTIPL